MATNSWTIEENEQFKNALELFCAFCPTRFKSIAEYLKKPETDVKEHYEKLVNDLLETGSSQVALPDGLTVAMMQNSDQVETTLWNRQEHEWFLIGLKRFGKDWEKIAVLLNSKSPIQVASYALNYFKWQNSKRNVMNQRRAIDTIMDLQLQQEHVVLERGHGAKVSDTKSYFK